MREIYLKQLTPEQKRRVAKAILEEIRRRVDLRADWLSDVRYLEWLAFRLGVDFEMLPHPLHPDGFYLPPFADGPDGCSGDGLVFFNPYRSHAKLVRILRHEIAHHLMVTWVASGLYGCDQVLCPAVDGAAVRHEIARQLEDML